MMADDFMGMLSPKGEEGEDDGPDAQREGAADLLGSLLGSGGGGGLGALLGGLMGGGGTPAAQNEGDLGGMLGGLMGGGAPAGQAGSGDLGGMLGGLLGGGEAPAGQGGGGLGALLGGLLGGGAPSTFGGGGGATLPFADTLARKLGISPQMANMLIMGAIGLLTSAAAKKQSGRNVDINSLHDPDFIRSSGVASRLSAQMGVSEDEAITGLQQAMGLMAEQAGPSQPVAKTGARKTSARKTSAKKTASAGGATAKPRKKKAPKKDSGSDFMDLLDEPK